MATTELPPALPKVGIAVFVTSPKHPGCVLLGVRKGSHGAQKYSPPGGHLEFGESWEECACREVLEETALKLKNVKFGTATNAVWTEENRTLHYVDIVMTGEVDSNYKEEPENPEPHKCEGWEWHHWETFPAADSLFKPLNMILETGYSPFTSSL